MQLRSNAMIELIIICFITILFGSLILEGLRAIILGLWWMLSLPKRAFNQMFHSKGQA
jgi:hypothetical protein